MAYGFFFYFHIVLFIYIHDQFPNLNSKFKKFQQVSPFKVSYSNSPEFSHHKMGSTKINNFPNCDKLWFLNIYGALMVHTGEGQSMSFDQYDLWCSNLWRHKWNSLTCVRQYDNINTYVAYI